MIKKILAFVAVFTVSSVIFVGSSFAATHTVQKGEDLSKIALKYDTTVKAIMKLNKLDSSKIQVNQIVEIPKEKQNNPLANPKPKVKEVKKAPAKKPSPTHPSNVKKTIKMTATAYTANCKGCTGITKIGLNLRKNPSLKVIAVDPRVIPLGSKVWVEGYGVAIAGDTGGAIKGNKIDIFVKNKSTAYQWGRKNVTVKVLKS